MKTLHVLLALALFTAGCSGDQGAMPASSTPSPSAAASSSGILASPEVLQEKPASSTHRTNVITQPALDNPRQDESGGGGISVPATSATPAH